MKMKSFAMLALSGLLAASCAYIAPAIADTNASQTMQPAVDNSANSLPSQSDNSMDIAGLDNNSNNSSDSTGSDPSNSASNSTSPGDEGGPDTATGDDDY